MLRITIICGGIRATRSARINPFANYLKKCGAEIKIIAPLRWDLLTKGKVAELMSLLLTYPPKGYKYCLGIRPDIIIIARDSTPQMYMLQKFFEKNNTKVIFDLNDALFLPTASFLRLNIRPGSFCLERMIMEADYVTLNGHYLLNYAKDFNNNACIIHDPVDTELFHPKNKTSNNSKIVITWEGNARVHYENLAMLVKPLKRIAKEYGKKVEFKIVNYLGDQRVRKLFSPLEKFMKVEYGSKRWLSSKEFAEMLYDSDIMVAPLRSTQWYEGKSALRVGIGMAMGIPVVASPVGEQKYVIKHGVNGFIARNEEEWYNYLKMLIEDENLRREIGREGRKTAEKELSLKVNGEKLFKIIKTVVES